MAKYFMNIKLTHKEIKHVTTANNVVSNVAANESRDAAMYSKLSGLSQHLPADNQLLLTAGRQACRSSSYPHTARLR
jgi:hypothetical protein